MDKHTTEARLSAAMRWEAFYQRELRREAATIRSTRITVEAVERACRDRKLPRARRAVEALRGGAPTDAKVRARVREDLAREIARPSN